MTSTQPSVSVDSALSQLKLVQSENENLKTILVNTQEQCEILEQEIRFQTAKATDLQVLLTLKDRNESSEEALTATLTANIMEKSLKLAQQALEFDRIQKKIQESEKKRQLIDQEREASAEMTAMLSRVIRDDELTTKVIDKSLLVAEQSSEIDRLNAKVNELEELLIISRKEDDDALMKKIVDRSLEVVDQKMAIDRLVTSLEESVTERDLYDHERQAHVEMMAEMSKIIREQQYELDQRWKHPLGNVPFKQKQQEEEDRDNYSHASSICINNLQAEEDKIEVDSDMLISENEMKDEKNGFLERSSDIDFPEIRGSETKLTVAPKRTSKQLRSDIRSRLARYQNKKTNPSIEDIAAEIPKHISSNFCTGNLDE
jgi:hypothetical protein